jgi:hypothetical protein
MRVQAGLRAEDDPNGEWLEAAETTGNWGFCADQAGDAVNENGAENWGGKRLAPLSQLSSNSLRIRTAFADMLKASSAQLLRRAGGEFRTG